MLDFFKRALPAGLLLLALELASPLQGFTLVMDNGDLITGEFVREDEESVLFAVAYLGEVRLPKERIANLDKLKETFEVPMEEGLQAEKNLVKKAIEEIGSEEPEKTESGEESEASPDQFMEGYAQFLKTLLPFHDWKKRLQMGMTSQSGRKDKTDIYYRYDMNLKGDLNHYRFNAEYVYGKSGETKTAEKFGSDLQWRRDISPGVFYQTKTVYAFDEIKGIDSNFEQTLGLGTRFIDSKSMVLSSGLGASGRWRAFEKKDEEVAYLVDLFQDWDYKINDRLRLRQDLRLAVPLEEQDDYEYKLTASLVSELTEAINVSLRYEYGYDNSLDEASREDRRFVSSLGYSF